MSQVGTTNLLGEDAVPCRQLFGGQCNQGRISEELLVYSDHRLHEFALRHGLQDYLLDDEAIMSSAKCQLMVELLRDLQVCCLCNSRASARLLEYILTIYSDVVRAFVVGCCASTLAVLAAGLHNRA